MCHQIASLKYHLPDLPLPDMRYDELQALRGIITARPMVRRMKDAKKPVEPKPIGVITVRNWLRLLGQAFKWFRQTGRWRRPLEMESEELKAVFGLTKKQQLRLARSKEERDRLTNPDPTPLLEELAVYYKLAIPNQRLYLLLGIRLGWRQMEISELRKSQIRLRGNEYFIDFNRTKTGVKGSVWLCPELADLLIKRVQSTPINSEDRALLGCRGLPLVRRSKKGNVLCAITQVWDRLRVVAERNGVEGYSFSALRRFAGQSVANLGDPFLAQVLLAQSVDSVLEQHYAARGIGVGIGQTAFQKLYQVQRQVWASLKPMFDAVNTDMPTLKKQLQDA